MDLFVWEKQKYMRKEVLIAQLISYFIILDKQIHSNEMNILGDYWRNNFFNDEEKKLCFNILGDKDEKIPFEDLIDEIGKIEFEHREKQEFIALLCDLIVCDTHIDESEYKHLEKVARKIKYQNIKSILDLAYSQVIKNKEEKELKKRPKVNTLGLKILSIFSFGRTKKEIGRKINRFVLQGPLFGDAIRSGTSIAKNDMVFITSIIDKNSNAVKECINSVKITLNNNVQNSNSKEAKEFEKCIFDYVVMLEKKLLPSVIENKEVLNRKKRAMSYFTVSFLGKTKAGKSTLHSVMTGGGDAFIGAGSQRTTRFNRVYEWENIRIIDTPGIGAAEEGGRTDEEIALSIIDETDVLCYVVTSDNVQKTEFNFMESIKSRNKPIIILLNIKKDFTRPEALFKKFVQNPHYWAERTDEENIQGHINHINDYIGQLECFNAQFVNIIPVQLLAARLSNEKEFKQYRDKLYEGSHIDYFLDYIRESIIESITLRRSQTIIDGTTFYIHKNINEIIKFHDVYFNLTEKINHKKINLVNKIKNDIQKVKENCLQDLETLFEIFREQINEFAENNYDLKKSVLEKAWVSYAKEKMKVEKRIEETIEKQVEQEKKDIQEYLADFASDMNSFFEYKNFELKTSNMFNFKRLFSVVGTGLGVAAAVLFFIPGLNVVAWIVTGVAILVGLLSNLFKNKEELSREAIQKLTDSLQTSMNENRQKVIESVPKVIEKTLYEISKQIEAILNKIQSGAEAIEKNSKKLLAEYEKSFDLVNKYYARRICDFLENKCKSKLEIDDYISMNVERDYGNRICIKNGTNYSKERIEMVKNVLQESIDIL